MPRAVRTLWWKACANTGGRASGALLPLLLTVLLAVSRATAAAPGAPYPLEVPAGSPLALSAQVDLDSGSAKVGDKVAFVVTTPLVVKGLTLVATSAPGRGSVVYSRPARVAGRGELMVEVHDVQAVDGSWIPVGVRQGDKTGLAGLVEASMMSLTEPTFPRGRDGMLRSSQVLPAWTLEARTFVVTPGSNPPRIVAAPPSAPGTLQGHRTLVAAGTKVRIRALVDIVSGQVQVGDRVKFQTVEAVTVEGRKVVAVGAEALGTVLRAIESGAANQAGELVVSIDSVCGVDGRPLPLNRYAGHRGDSNRVLSLGADLIVPLSGLAIHGSQAVISRDEVFDVAVSEDRLVVVPPPGAGRD